MPRGDRTQKLQPRHIPRSKPAPMPKYGPDPDLRYKPAPMPKYGPDPDLRYKPAPMPKYGPDPRYKPAPMPKYGPDPRYKPAPMPKYGPDPRYKPAPMPTWSYGASYDDPKDYDDITMESIMKEMEEDAIRYPEGSTPGGMENYFLPEGDVVELEKGIGPMWQRFLDRFRGPEGFEFGLPKYNSGGIASLPGGQWSPSTITGDEEIYDIKPLQMDPGIMSIDDLEDLFEEAGMDKRIIYQLINTGGLSQLLS